MAGLQKLCKLYGSMTNQGKKYVWDYAEDKPVLESSQTKEQWAASERKKWEGVKSSLEKAKTQ